MGYLNNTVITVDAILTKKGRELLARNDPKEVHRATLAHQSANKNENY